MSRSALTVETSRQAALIFGGPPELTTALIRELVGRDVFAVQVGSREQLQKIVAENDPDYLVVFAATDPELLDSIPDLVTRFRARLIYLSSALASAPPQLASLHPAKIFYSDYLGTEELSSPLLASWIASIGAGEGINIAGDGLAEISLLTLGDLAALISRAVLLPGTTSEALYLGNPARISLLNLAYLVRTSLGFKINLRFDPGLLAPENLFTKDLLDATLSRLDYLPEGDVEAALRAYLKRSPPGVALKKPPVVAVPPIRVEAKKLTPLKLAPPVFVPLEPKNPRWRPRLPKIKASRVVTRGILIALALYLATIFFALTVFVLGARSLAASLKKPELPKPSALNRFAATYLQANWAALTSPSPLARSARVQEITRLLDVYHQALDALPTAGLLTASVKDILDYTLAAGDADIASAISRSRLHSEELYQQLSLIDGELGNDPPQVLPDKYSPQYLALKSRLAELKRSVLATKAALATVPDFIGLGGRKKYAVLFQNNTELRATGGFIGSLAILSFENGKLYDMPIYDVYDADGQLKGHVEPPAPIKDILGESNWYLRDSNFDPDFPSSARRAEWFIKKSLNLDLDGTIGVNVYTLQDILDATGPLEVKDYNETISADNLYERAQYHAEVNFFPGSTQKKEFLSTVASALFTKLASLSPEEGVLLAAALSRSVDSKNTLISLTSPTSAGVFQKLGWSGELLAPPCPTETNCYQDYAMVVDSNFGVNKANYYVKRNIKQVITFDKNLSVSHTLRLSYQNSATSASWPAGAYKNYQRLYLPVGANIVSVTVGDKTLSASEYTVSSEHNRLVLAHLVTVPISETVEIEIIYTTPQLTRGAALTYSWYWQKQSGTADEDMVTVYLNYPLYLNPTVVSPEAEVAPQQLKFDLKNSSDRRVTVQFSE